jgi:hypothetical protein
MIHRTAIVSLCAVCYVLILAGCGGGIIENEEPSIKILQPAEAGDHADTSYVIVWKDDDPDDDAEISLYYDTDSSGRDGIPIAEGISEDSEDDQYSWDTSELAAADYYVYAVIDDGINDADADYADHPVTVSHVSGDNEAPIITITEPAAGGNTATSSFRIRWTDSDIDDDASISLYYDTDNTGYDGTLIVSGLSEDSSGDSYLWSTSALAEDEYYVYAVIYDGTNAGVNAYSPGRVSVWDGILDKGTSDIRLSTPATAGEDNSTDQRICSDSDRVYAVWVDSRNDITDIYFNRSTDGGETWESSDTIINTNDAGEAYSYRPQIACSGDYVYVVWEDRRNGSYYDIYMNCSADRGSTWLSSDIRLDTDNAGASDSKHARLACSGNNVYVVSQDERNGRSDIYFNYSPDAGDTWQSSDIRIDNKTADEDSRYPRITASGNRVYIILEDYRDGSHSEVYFNYLK